MDKKQETPSPKKSIFVQKFSDESELHWFWRITSKWWFFPALYILLTYVSYIYLLLNSGYGFGQSVLGALFVTLFQPFGMMQGLSYILSEVPYLLIIVSFMPYILLMMYGTILYFKYKKKIIPKLIILTLLFLILLSFVVHILQTLAIVY